MTSVDPTPGSLDGLAGQWTLSPGQSSFEFHTKAMWVLKVKGTMQATSGEGSVSPAGAVDGRVVLDATTIDTGTARRDTHLRTADFFDVDAYPTVEFVLTGSRLISPGSAEVTGTLTIHGVTRTITLPVTIETGADSVTISGELDIDRSEYGITWAKMGAAVDNHVVVRAHFTKA
jgi:polyisoprenoid-binding protein YceI